MFLQKLDSLCYAVQICDITHRERILSCISVTSPLCRYGFIVNQAKSCKPAKIASFPLDGERLRADSQAYAK